MNQSHCFAYRPAACVNADVKCQCIECIVAKPQIRFHLVNAVAGVDSNQSIASSPALCKVLASVLYGLSYVCNLQC